MTDRIIVTTFDGTYDEVLKAELHDINKRKHCWRGHSLINASLYWGANYIDIKRSHDSSKSITGDGIRFCKRCKLIDCMHYFDTVTAYEIKFDAYYSEINNVGHCITCGCRISLGGCGSVHPSARSYELITQVSKELNVTWPANFGSGWSCEFPVAVSRIIDSQGEDHAKSYIRDCFMRGSCESAMHSLKG